MTIEDILTLKNDLMAYYGNARAQMQQAKDYYDGNIRNFPRLSTSYPTYIPPTARAIIDKAVDHIIIRNPAITVPKRKPTNEAQEQADKLERFYSALMRRIDAHQKEPLLRRAAKFALLCGMFVIKGPLWDTKVAGKPPQQGKEETLADFEERESSFASQRRYNLPIYAEAIDPTTVLFSPGVYPPEYVIEVCKKPGRYVNERWGLDTTAKEVEWIEYWDNKQRAYICEGKVVKGSEENILGYIPYLIGYSGLGYASEKPEDEIVGLLNPAFSALEAEARIMTALDFNIQKASYGAYQVKTDPSRIIIPGPGQVAQIPEGADLIPFPQPESAPDLYRMADIISRHIERVTYSDVLMGLPVPGDTSGYDRALRIGQATTKFGPVVEALNMQSSLFLSNVARLIEVVDEPLTVWANTPSGNLDETISAEDIQGHYTVFVKLSAVTPEEADAKSLLGLKLWQAGGISQLRFLEQYAMIPDASGEISRIDAERAKKNPIVDQAFAQLALIKWGLKELQEKLDPSVLQAILGSLGLGAQQAAPGAPESLTSTPPSSPTAQTIPGSLQELMAMANQKMQRRVPMVTQGQPLGSPMER